MTHPVKPTMPTIDDMLDQGERHARMMLLELKQPQLTPFYHLISADRDKPDAIIPCDFQSDRDKDMAVALATAIASNINARLAMFISEAWAASYAPDADLGADTTLRPSEHPARQEVVALTATDGTNHRYRTLIIVRNKRGKITALTRRPDHKEIALGGRMIDGVISGPASTLH